VAALILLYLAIRQDRSVAGPFRIRPPHWRASWFASRSDPPSEALRGLRALLQRPPVAHLDHRSGEGREY